MACPTLRSCADKQRAEQFPTLKSAPNETTRCYECPSLRRTLGETSSGENCPTNTRGRENTHKSEGNQPRCPISAAFQPTCAPNPVDVPFVFGSATVAPLPDKKKATKVPEVRPCAPHRGRNYSTDQWPRLPTDLFSIPSEPPGGPGAIHGARDTTTEEAFASGYVALSAPSGTATLAILLWRWAPALERFGVTLPLPPSVPGKKAPNNKKKCRSFIPCCFVPKLVVAATLLYCVE